MKLTVLGCNGPVPRPGQACCGYLLEQGDTHILLDCGSGVLSNLQKHLDYHCVEAIVVSHMHADHCFDLLAYRTALKLDMYRPLAFRPRLYLPPRGAETLANLAALMGHAASYFEDAFEVQEYDPEKSLRLGNLRLVFAPTVHRIPTFGVRIEGAAVLAYSADSGVCPALNELARRADLFLCEATFQGETNFPNRPHLKASEAGEIAQQAGVKRLLLTHIWHQLDPLRSLAEAGTAYEGPVEAVQEGKTYSVSNIVSNSVETTGGTDWQQARQR